MTTAAPASPYAATLHSLMSLLCELDRCATTEDMRRLVTTPGLVMQHYQRVKDTEGGEAVMRWLAEQLKGHINARALAAQGITTRSAEPSAAKNNQ